MSSASGTRRSKIVAAVSERGFVSVTELQLELGCSDVTVRRDLASLSRHGQLRRTHGGAVKNGSHELPYTSKVTAMAAAKKRIGEVAARMVSDGQAIGLTGGTTTQQVARALVAKQDLTVVTNAITVAMELANSSCRVIVTGGELRGTTYELVGPLTEPVAQQIHLDLVFVGVDGFSFDGGLTTHNPMEARVNRVFIDRSDKVIVVTDHTKLGHKTFAQIAPVTTASALVTDRDAPPEILDSLKESGIDVVTA
jgi:DeoR family transcriptional regulator, aga operon transcriptional repressor